MLTKHLRPFRCYRELPRIPTELVVHHILPNNPLPFAYVSKQLHRHSRIRYAELLLSIPYQDHMLLKNYRNTVCGDPYHLNFESDARKYWAVLDYARTFAVDILLNYDPDNANVTDLLPSVLGDWPKRAMSDKFVAFIFKARIDRTYDTPIALFRPLFVPEISLASKIALVAEYEEMGASTPLVCRTTGRLISEEVLRAFVDPRVYIVWSDVRRLKDSLDPTKKPSDIFLAFLNKRLTNKYSYQTTDIDVELANILLPFIEEKYPLGQSIREHKENDKCRIL